VRQVRDYEVHEHPIIVDERASSEGGTGLGVILGVILAIVVAGALVWLVLGGRGPANPVTPTQPSNPTININPPDIKVPDSINVNPPAQQPNNGGQPQGNP
jgi:hypothetical protein